jgi:nicotinate phosphoribosyltransferase
LPARIPRIALVDFNNDSIEDTLRVLDAMFAKYRELTDAGQKEKRRNINCTACAWIQAEVCAMCPCRRWATRRLDLGVNPRLVFNVRSALDSAWERWSLPGSWKEAAQEFCRSVKIVVSGGFNPEKIRRFEKLSVPADIYAVGSYLFNNNGYT